MNRCRLFALIPLTILGAGCATNAPRVNPFTVSKEEIRNRVKTVAVAPLQVADDIPNAAQATEEFAGLLTNELSSLGFQTVPPSEYDAIFKQMSNEVGGFFDPMTGKGDKEKYKKVLELCRRELATKFHADAVLYSSIAPASAAFGQGLARWHGVKESVTDGGWVQHLFVDSYKGTAPALSLYVLLRDTEGNQLFQNAGGVQLTSKLTAAGFARVVDQKLLADSLRNTNAVSAAFKPFREEETRHHRLRE